MKGKPAQSPLKKAENTVISTTNNSFGWSQGEYLHCWFNFLI